MARQQPIWRSFQQLLVPSAATILLGFRYITSRWIAWFSVLGFAVGILVLIVVTSVMNGFVSELRSSIRGSLSDIIVRPLLFSETSEPPDLEAVREVIAGVPGVDARSISPRITWLAMVAGMYENERLLGPDGAYAWKQRDAVDASAFLRRDDALACQVVGIDFQTDRLATNFGAAIRGFKRRATRHVRDLPVPLPDDPFQIETPPDPALLPAELVRMEDDGVRASSPGVFGAFLAAKLARTAYYAGLRGSFERGCEVKLLTFSPAALESVNSSKTLAPSFRNIVMAGTFRTGTYDIDVDKIFLDRRDMARNLLGISANPEGFYTELVLRTTVPEGNISTVRTALDQALREARRAHPSWRFIVSTWEIEKQSHIAAIDYEKKMMAFILMFIILVAGINMFTTLWMLVTEKTRDVGIISALGVSRIGVLQLFLTMGMFIALIGEILGLVGGLLIVENIGAIEDFLFRTFGFKMFDPTIYIFDHLPARPDPLTIAVILGTTFVGSILFSLAPAIRAARKDPVQALRYE